MYTLCKLLSSHWSVTEMLPHLLPIHCTLNFLLSTYSEQPQQIAHAHAEAPFLLHQFLKSSWTVYYEFNITQGSQGCSRGHLFSTFSKLWSFQYFIAHGDSLLRHHYCSPLPMSMLVWSWLDHLFNMVK